MAKKHGNCYVTCEALYHLMGGKKAGWTPMFTYHEGQPHWFLQHRKDTIWGVSSTIVDPTARQFRTKPDYYKAVGKGFLTKKPSKRARVLMRHMLWQD